MIQATMIIEDAVIVGTSIKGIEPEQLAVTVTDLHSGKQHSAVMGFREFSVMLVLALGLGEDDTIFDQPTVEHLYDVVNPVFANWPKETILVP